MSWYDSITNVLERGRAYSHDELVDRLKDTKPGLSASGYHWAISNMEKDGMLVRIGRGKYSLPDGEGHMEYRPVYSDLAKELSALVSRENSFAAFTVFETVLMNDFLNHLIAQNTIFLQVEKESSIYVFRFLQEKGYKSLMYKPTKKDFGLYWARDSVVVTDLISEAPLRNENQHEILLEKMLVDMCADKLISSTFSRSELPEVFEQAKSRYVLDQTRMLRYARRRNREDEIKQYMGNE